MKQLNKSRRLNSWAVLLIALILSVGNLTPALAQSDVTGKVTDEAGTAVVGATVSIVGTNQGAITDANGEFSLKATPAQKLQFSYLGYVTQTLDVGSRTRFDIVLKADSKALEEVVVVGYGVQKKATLTGAVAAVTSSDIVATKTQQVQNMLTGKLPGVRVVQRTSEPGNFDMSFDLRGFGTPMIVIDGIPSDNLGLLDPNDIESISVLKDASAAIYGVRAANGVVLVTTKKGRGSEGKFNLEYQFYWGLQIPSNLPRPVGAVDRMTMLNEKKMHNFDNPSFMYTPEQIEEYRNGTKKEYDWYDATIQNAPQHQHSISMHGSSDRVNYYLNMGYMYQEGFWKTGDLNFRRYNVRSNVETKISKRLTASLQLNGIMNERQKPFYNTMEVFKALWRTPTNEPFYANDNPEYPNLVLGAIIPSTVLTNKDMTGSNIHNGKTFEGIFSLDYDVPYITGLKAKGLFSYDMSIDDDNMHQKEFDLYTYDPAGETYAAKRQNTPEKIQRNYYHRYRTMMQFSLNYDRTFNSHHVGALLLYEESVNQKDNFYALRELGISMDYLLAGNSLNQIGFMDKNNLWKTVNKGLVGRVNYDYKSKYMLEFSFRYDGSSKFAKGHQWGFFPGGSIGWRISEEPFIKESSALSFIDNLKLRASYGMMGDENASSYQFLTGYDFPASSNYREYPGGSIFDGGFVPALGFRQLPNELLTWYTVKTANIGLDAELWKGMLGITFDLFQRDRDGLMATRASSIPETVGAAMPQENLESDRTMGFELALSHRNRIGSDFSYNVNANISLTRTKWTDRVRESFGNSWDYWRFCEEGRYTNIMFGHGADGQYNSWDDIINSPVFVGKGTLPGDYRYEDYNGDGVIDGEDHHPIATNSIPQLYYGFSIGAQYKGFDLDLLFQGAAMSHVSFPEMFNEPLMWNGNALEQFLDRWHPSDPAADPYDPNTKWNSGYYAYTGTKMDQSSMHSAENASYLRLKSIELGYTLPKRLVSKIGIQKARIYINCYNLLTFSSLDYVDPEHPNSEWGYVYPLNKTVNIGANLVF